MTKAKKKTPSYMVRGAQYIVVHFTAAEMRRLVKLEQHFELATDQVIRKCVDAAALLLWVQRLAVESEVLPQLLDELEPKPKRIRSPRVVKRRGKR